MWCFLLYMSGRSGQQGTGRGELNEWVEQQQQQRGAWAVRAISAEAANRDLEARLSRANDDKRAAEMQLAAVTRDRDRLASRVKTLERDLAAARKATGGRPPGQTREGAEGAEGPTAERAGGPPTPAGVRYLLAGSQAWHAQAEAAAGQMSAVATGLRMALLAGGQSVEVATVAPDLARVIAAHEDAGRQYPPHRLTAAAMDASFAEAVEQSSQGSAGRSSAPGGGGGSSPFDFGTTCPF